MLTYLLQTRTTAISPFAASHDYAFRCIAADHFIRSQIVKDMVVLSCADIVDMMAESNAAVASPQTVTIIITLPQTVWLSLIY